MEEYGGWISGSLNADINIANQVNRVNIICSNTIEYIRKLGEETLLKLVQFGR